MNQNLSTHHAAIAVDSD